MCGGYFPCGYDRYLTEATVLTPLPVAGSKNQKRATRRRKGLFGTQFQVTVHPWKDEGLGVGCQQFEAANHDASTVKSREL